MKSLALQSTRGCILTEGAKSGCKAISSRYALDYDVVFDNHFVQGTPTQCVGAFCWPLGYIWTSVSTYVSTGSVVWQQASKQAHFKAEACRP